MIHLVLGINTLGFPVSYRAPEQATRRHCAQSLPDLLAQTPPLLECLPTSSRATLLGCSRQLRDYVHSITRKVVVRNSEHVANLLNRHWPVDQLAVIVLRTTPDQRPSQQPYHGDDASTTQARMVGSSVSGKFPRVLFLVRQEHQQHFHQPCQFSLALSHLHKPQLAKRIERLVFRHANLQADHIAYLVSADLPALRQLDLSGNQLDAAATACIAKGRWPCGLNHLDVSMCDLDTDALACLVTGDWPDLHTLHLSANPRLDSTAMALLSTSNWRTLGRLYIRCTALNSMSIRGVRFLTCHQLAGRGLYQLDLRWAGLDATAVAELALADLSQLRMLYMGGNDLGADGVAALVSAQLPCLEILGLSTNKLDAAAAEQLSKGNWLHLRTLSLADNLLDNAAMQHVALGNWRLSSLKLCGNPMDVNGVLHLNCAYRKLKTLYLDASLFDATLWDIFELDATSMLECATRLETVRSITVQRENKPALHKLRYMPWLHEIRFCRFPTPVAKYRSENSKYLTLGRLQKWDPH